MASLPAHLCFMLLLLVGAGSCRKLPHETGRHLSEECIWDAYSFHPNISAWEFQAQPHRHTLGHSRDKAIAKVESLLGSLNSEHNLDALLVPQSRWMGIFREHTFQLSTRHGHTLHTHKRLPFCGVAYLRLRSYEVLSPAGAYVPSAMPGTADLTLKMKKVNPDHGVPELEMECLVEGAKLSAKMENDIHCDHQRVTFSPIFKPVSQKINVSTVSDALPYFTNVAELMALDAQEPLPFIHDVWRAKVVWTVVVNGVVAEANLVIKYNTTFQDAVAGSHPKNGELSMRIRREVARSGDEELKQALDTIGLAMQVFRDHGWDGKTPSVTPSNNHALLNAGGWDDDADLDLIDGAVDFGNLQHNDSRCMPADHEPDPAPCPQPRHHCKHGKGLGHGHHGNHPHTGHHASRPAHQHHQSGQQRAAGAAQPVLEV